MLKGGPRILGPVNNPVQGIGVDLCAIVVCPGPCGKTFIDAIRQKFPSDWMCQNCMEATGEVSTRKQAQTAYLLEHKRCVNGHALTETTTYVAPGVGHHVRCRLCRAAMEKRRSAKRRARERLAREQRDRQS